MRSTLQMVELSQGIFVTRDDYMKSNFCYQKKKRKSLWRLIHSYPVPYFLSLFLSYTVTVYSATKRPKGLKC